MVLRSFFMVLPVSMMSSTIKTFLPARLSRLVSPEKDSFEVISFLISCYQLYWSLRWNGHSRKTWVWWSPRTPGRSPPSGLSWGCWPCPACQQRTCILPWGRIEREEALGHRRACRRRCPAPASLSCPGSSHEEWGRSPLRRCNGWGYRRGWCDNLLWSL